MLSQGHLSFTLVGTLTCSIGNGITSYLTPVQLKLFSLTVYAFLALPPLRLVAYLLLLALAPGIIFGQKSDLKILGGYQRIALPFELENDFIVIDVVLDNVLPLRFLIDTGAENTVLLEKRLADGLKVSYRRTFSLRGADATTELTAHLATGIDLRLANRLLARNRSMLVLEENYFDFERVIGTTIHGILGADFLMRFVCEFDFKRRVLILHEPNKYKPSRRHVRIAAEFIRNRAYLDLPVGVSQQTTTNRRLLLDSGAGLSLLLNTYGDSTSFDLPEQSLPTYIATGLGGSLEGSVGRSRRIDLGGKSLRDVVTYFQPLDTTGMDFLNNREGIIGNRILKRFNVVLDYSHQIVYFKPERRIWKEKFDYDRSGISVIAGGQSLRTFTVASIIEDSPAYRAGMRIGDRLVAFNGKSVGFLSLNGIISRLEGKVGRKIKIRYRRKGEYFVAEFRLEDLI